MRRRSRASSEPTKVRRRKTVTLKRRNAPKAVVRRSSSAADKETKVALFKRERDEALEQQAATSEILHVISNSPTNVQMYSTRSRAAQPNCAKRSTSSSIASMETSCVSSPITARCRPATSRFTVGRWVAAR